MTSPFEDLVFIGAITDTSRRDNSPIPLRLIKLAEEVGELNAAYLAFAEAPNASASATGNITEEAVDVIICAIDVLNKIGNIRDLNQMIELKTAKWRAKLPENQ